MISGQIGLEGVKMTKCEKFGEILQTTNYSLFNKLLGNRKIREAHVAQLMVSMSKKQLIVPIIVNQNMEIVDGQHRFEAIRRLGLTCYYIGIEGYNLEDCHILNANNKTYRLEDFENGFCELGYDEYKRLREFRFKFPFLSMQLCLLYLAGGYKKNVYDDFKNGNYKIDNYELACMWAERTFDFQKFGIKFVGSRNFNLAMIKLYSSPKYDHARMLSKIEYQTGDLRPQAKEKFYLEMLCNVYNLRTKDEDRIYPYELVRR